MIAPVLTVVPKIQTITANSSLINPERAAIKEDGPLNHLTHSTKGNKNMEIRPIPIYAWDYGVTLVDKDMRPLADQSDYWSAFGMVTKTAFKLITPSKPNP